MSRSQCRIVQHVGAGSGGCRTDSIPDVDGSTGQRGQIGRSQLSGYEKGKLNPSFESLLRIMAVLKADFHDLHNAVKVAAGKLDEVCASRRLEPETEEFLGRLGVALRDLYKPQAG